jgi:predicted metal-binding membrane protein
MWMVAAMMIPQVLSEVRRTAEDSLWGRRNRAVTGFLAGYIGPSLAAGIVVAFLRQGSWTHALAAPALGFVAAAAWTLSPGRRRVLIACHQRLPLAPTGWRADYDCLRYGVAIGAACLRKCWPLMLACALSGHHLAAMAGGMIVGVVEQRSFRSPARYAFWGALALAGYFGVRAVIG